MDVSLRQERAQLNQRDIWLASDCVENKICVSLNLVRVPVAALWPWARIALSCVESAIANRARRADAKPFRRLAARHPACNCGNNAFTKIEGQRLHHARQPPLPARILNQNKTDSGIPSDSIRQETALAESACGARKGDDAHPAGAVLAADRLSRLRTETHKGFIRLGF